jgi:luciferase-type oxidoreductase
MLTVNRTARPSDCKGFQRMFAPGRLTVGVFFPIEAFPGDQPTMLGQEGLARRAEELGYAALWCRDVPLRDPSFGDLGQVYDPWVYLGWIAAQTKDIALATGALVLTLRHPLHTAKGVASVDRLSGNRLVLGVASGDRPVEFPAFAVDFDQRYALFRENLRVVRATLNEEFPQLQSPYGALNGYADLVPKPITPVPMLVTGHSGQPLEWIAKSTDGWITYPRGLQRQAEVAAQWRAAVEAAAPGAFKPFVQSFYVDLSEDPDAAPTPIHLGLRGGRNFILRFLEALRSIGVNHVILNFKYGARNAGDVLDEIGREILPQLAARQADGE